MHKNGRKKSKADLATAGTKVEAKRARATKLGKLAAFIGMPLDIHVEVKVVFCDKLHLLNDLPDLCTPTPT